MSIKDIGRWIQRRIDWMRGKRPDKPQPPPVEDIKPPVPGPAPQPPPEPDPVPPPASEQPPPVQQAVFRWVPIPGVQVHAYIPTRYIPWKLGIWTGQGHSHVEPFQDAPWWWTDRGQRQADGTTLFVIPVAPEELQRRALSYRRASGDLLLFHANTEAVAEDGRKSVSWFVRPMVEVLDSPSANIRNFDNNWQGRP